MIVRIASEALERIMAAAAGSDDEICGLLFGTQDTIGTVLPCRNVAAEPRYRFEIDPVALIAAHRTARAGGPAITGCYHSHPSGLPQPSVHDAAEAAANGWLWLIIAAGQARLFRAARAGSLHARFDPVPLAID